MRIGIIGAGQLGQMLGLAARELDLECCFLDPAESPPAATVGRHIRAEYDDTAALERLADQSDVVSYEFENVPVGALSAISDRVAVRPPPAALSNAQDRLSEKRLFEELEIPLPGYFVVNEKRDIERAIDALGLPLVVKTRRFGYDGKGQAVIRAVADIDDAWGDFDGRPAIAEQWVQFDAEVSVIGARSARGDIVVWPLTENEHSDGILRVSRAPAPQQTLKSDAENYIGRLLDALGYIGVLALELFVVGDRLLANEFAPRVHNSGHWTIEGAETSQFTNHLLAITGRRLGATTGKGHAGMVNLIGRIPDAARELSLPQCQLHDYGKAPRPGRKLGHITIVAETAAERDDVLANIRKIVT